MKKTYEYGQQPSDLKQKDLKLGWLAGVRHLKSGTAAKSFWHRHAEIQFLYCFKGEYVYEFRSAPQTVLTAGHLIVIPAGVEHRHLQAIDPAGHRVELLVALSGDDRYAPFPRSVAASLVEAILVRTCEAVPCRHGMGALFAELDAIATTAAGGQPRADDLALARTIACLILQRYVAQLRAAPESVGHAGKTDAMIVAEAVQWLERHFAEKIDVSQLVAYIGYSRSRLFEIFKKHAGLSPGDLLMRYRIKKAREMLATDEPAISDISAACGFSSPQYFNYVFKKQTGATPSEWRAGRGFSASFRS